MLIRLIKNFFNLFIDEEKEYIYMKLREYHDLFYNSGKYPLNNKQCEAVVKNRRYNQVIAAAGTGKTTVLSYRIKYLIEEGIEPERIVAITYSKKAAKEMEVRLKKQFNINNVEVRTIHSFANKIVRNESKEKLSLIRKKEIKNTIIREFNKLIERDRPFKNNYLSFLRYSEKHYLNNSFYENNRIEINNDIIDNIIDFIDLAKKNNIKPDKIKKLLKRNNKRQYYFGLCAQRLYDKFQLHLRENKKIDFNDMIYKAVDTLKRKPEKFYKDYDHMLIDEFQDVSLGQIEFIKQFFTKDSKMKLFCVGDDWQSIYSFQGSEPKYFIKFGKYFGQAAKTYLVDNYRCPATVINVGNLLISKNKAQINKEVKVNNKYDSSPILHILKKGSRYNEYLIRYTLTLIKRILRNGSKPADIMVLCRYDAALPYLDKVKNLLKKEKIPYIGKGNDYYNPDTHYLKPENAVSVFSIHQSKGREAENVIILHVVAEGQHSFPEAERENELLEAVKINKTDHFEEERRLFYVAISRTSKKLHILSQANNLSPFVKEVEEFFIKKRINSIVEIDDYVDFKAKVYKLWKDHDVKIQQIGLLKDKKGNFMKFISWNNKAPELRLNTWYKFSNVKVSLYNDQRELVLSDITKVIPLYKEVVD